MSAKDTIKKLIAYDKLYDSVKTSFFYQAYKKYRAALADKLYDSPSKDFFVIGVTGTNGKTTTVNILHNILNDHVAPTVAISTATIKIGNEDLVNEKKMTSLDNFDLQSLLATAKERGCKIAIIEVSSHGLDQRRFEGITFDFAVLTNITREHIDYHGSMNNYVETKKQLFKYVLANGKENKYAAFSVDDRYGKKRFEEMAFDKKVSFSLQSSAILKATRIEEHLEGTYFEFSYLGQKYSGTTQLIGSYNVSNILAALAVSTEIGLAIPLALKSVESFRGVAGRMEPVYANGVKYFIDFAHTPDGLEKTLEFAQKAKGNGKLITVFGAPGNRDKEKRPMMGDIAHKYADVIIVSDDDPDTENRLKILHQISYNFQENFSEEDKEIFIIPERKYAIQFCVDIAKPGDTVVFAGKGHEVAQLTNFGKRDWNDKKVLTQILQESGIALEDSEKIRHAFIQRIQEEKRSANHLTVEQYLEGAPVSSASSQKSALFTSS
ncbi:MAG: UDP-N-acetylmuramoyl-L-alanyl-D-glutamate--2,6-diaminopimelate ligase [Candidatus Absconditabacteria bacterium]|nr:UDP-N-acetylmuramoyl-L-alanyl-D-glutamate--2,6-diaminopimelate ligase [Candidatus Absconditabacteria bacterium]